MLSNTSSIRASFKNIPVPATLAFPDYATVYVNVTGAKVGDTVVMSGAASAAFDYSGAMVDNDNGDVSIKLRNMGGAFAGGLADFSLVIIRATGSI